MLCYLVTAGSLDDMKDFVAEIAVMKAFHHPNVLPLLGVCIDYDDEDVLKIVIPFMANGNLRHFLKNSRLSPYNTHEYPAVRIYTYCSYVRMYLVTNAIMISYKANFMGTHKCIYVCTCTYTLTHRYT